LAVTPGGINDNKFIEFNEFGHSIVFDEKINEEVHGMKERPGDERERVVKRKRFLFSVVILFLLSLFLSGCALGHSAWWKEEVLLHDGQTMIVDRSISRGGRHELGQESPISEETARFTPPGTRKSILWKSEFDPNIGVAGLGLLAVDIVNGTPYIAAKTRLCPAYNLWGRPNPPYIFLKYTEGKWRQISLEEFPSEIKNFNVVISIEEERIKAAALSTGFVTIYSIRELNNELKQDEYRYIIREPMPQRNIGCPFEIYDGTYWRGAGSLLRQPTFEVCINECKNIDIKEEYCPCEKLFKSKIGGIENGKSE